MTDQKCSTKTVFREKAVKPSPNTKILLPSVDQSLQSITNNLIKIYGKLDKLENNKKKDTKVSPETLCFFNEKFEKLESVISSFQEKLEQNQQQTEERVFSLSEQIDSVKLKLDSSIEKQTKKNIIPLTLRIQELNTRLERQEEQIESLKDVFTSLNSKIEYQSTFLSRSMHKTIEDNMDPIFIKLHSFESIIKGQNTRLDEFKDLFNKYINKNHEMIDMVMAESVKTPEKLDEISENIDDIEDQITTLFSKHSLARVDADVKFEDVISKIECFREDFFNTYNEAINQKSKENQVLLDQLKIFYNFYKNTSESNDSKFFSLHKDLEKVSNNIGNFYSDICTLKEALYVFPKNVNTESEIKESIVSLEKQVLGIQDELRDGYIFKELKNIQKSMEGLEIESDFLEDFKEYGTNVKELKSLVEDIKDKENVEDLKNHINETVKDINYEIQREQLDLEYRVTGVEITQKGLTTGQLNLYDKIDKQHKDMKKQEEENHQILAKKMDDLIENFSKDDERFKDIIKLVIEKHHEDIKHFDDNFDKIMSKQTETMKESSRQSNDVITILKDMLDYFSEVEKVESGELKLIKELISSKEESVKKDIVQASEIIIDQIISHLRDDSQLKKIISKSKNEYIAALQTEMEICRTNILKGFHNSSSNGEKVLSSPYLHSKEFLKENVSYLGK